MLALHLLPNILLERRTTPLKIISKFEMNQSFADALHLALTFWTFRVSTQQIRCDRGNKFFCRHNGKVFLEWSKQQRLCSRVELPL